MVESCTRFSQENDTTVHENLYINVRSLWQYIIVPNSISKDESSVKGSQWFYKFFGILISATSPLLKFFSSCDLIDVSIV